MSRVAFHKIVANRQPESGKQHSKLARGTGSLSMEVKDSDDYGLGLNSD